MGIRRSSLRSIAALGAAIAIVAVGVLAIVAPPTGRPHRAKAIAGADGTRIVVSLNDRRLWLLRGSDTLMATSVAVGKGQTFTYGGRTFRFQTPRGQRRVLAKEVNPVWTPPEWHYLERAAREGLEPVELKAGQEYRLGDGTYIEVRDDQVGRVNRFGNFWPITPGTEIIFDGKIYIPPTNTAQRRVPDALGTRKLDLGNGYLIHGTHVYNADSIGRAVSHGCIRMKNDEVERLYDLVQVGTPVYIY
jgi:lipoprotein-anchoring transpeptidase ErfK/SrfK